MTISVYLLLEDLKKKEEHDKEDCTSPALQLLPTTVFVVVVKTSVMDKSSPYISLKTTYCRVLSSLGYSYVLKNRLQTVI